MSEPSPAQKFNLLCKELQELGMHNLIASLSRIHPDTIRLSLSGVTKKIYMLSRLFALRRHPGMSRNVDALSAYAYMVARDCVLHDRVDAVLSPNQYTWVKKKYKEDPCRVFTIDTEDYLT